MLELFSGELRLDLLISIIHLWWGIEPKAIYSLAPLRLVDGHLLSRRAQRLTLRERPTRNRLPYTPSESSSHWCASLFVTASAAIVACS